MHENRPQKLLSCQQFPLEDDGAFPNEARGMNRISSLDLARKQLSPTGCQFGLDIDQDRTAHERERLFDAAQPLAEGASGHALVLGAPSGFESDLEAAVRGPSGQVERACHRRRRSHYLPPGSCTWP